MRGVLVGVALVGCLVLSGCATPSTPSATTSGHATSTAAKQGPSTLAAGPTGSATSSGTSPPTGTSTPPASGGGNSGSSSNGGNGSAAPANHAPAIAKFTANATGLAVRFAVNATDADGDALTATLSFGDGSANATGALAALNLTHTYAAAGNYTARLVVSDGHASANATLVVAAKAGGGPVDHRTCSGLVGLSGSTVSGAGQSLGGCSLGKATGAVTVVALSQSSGCKPQAAPDGSTYGDDAVGKTWPDGTTFRVLCSAGTATFSGTLDLVAA